MPNLHLAVTPLATPLSPPNQAENGVRLAPANSNGRSAHRGRKFGLGLSLTLVALLAYGAYGHYARSDRAVATLVAAAAQLPVVRTARVVPAAAQMTIDLPGSTEAFDMASIYPRAYGYVTRRLADIGTRVKQGDLLAVIQSPELDRQLKQAQAKLAETAAALNQAQVNQRLAKLTADRYAALAGKHYATQQEADNYRLAVEARAADVRSAEATVDAQKAEIQRLQEMTKYERVEAPFDGVIVSRHVDVGDLSNADSGNLIASGNYLFREADDNELRILVDVPQSAAIGIVNGLTASISVPEIPGRTFTGRIARIAGALSEQTRTLRVEVDISNRDHVLKPGLYINVHIQVPRTTPAITVPSQALIFSGNGMQVATVVDGTIALRIVRIAEDQGTTVTVDDGLRGDEHVVLNPFVDIADGQKVTIKDDPAKTEAP